MIRKKYNIHKSWLPILNPEFKKIYLKDLLMFVQEERKIKTIFPNEEEVFAAFTHTNFNNLKVVIIGQDPYHGKEQAHGLSFSVPTGTKIPPSLRNIFKELQNDLNITFPKHGNLTEWSKQGVLLLNSTLTVQKNEPLSHQKIGWQIFTDNIISQISINKTGIIFLLWGKFAFKKSKLINNKSHYIFSTTHPSPFSAHKGFLGCKHFSKTNKILIQNNQKPINWQLCSNSLTLF